MVTRWSSLKRNNNNNKLFQLNPKNIYAFVYIFYLCHFMNLLILWTIIADLNVWAFIWNGIPVISFSENILRILLWHWSTKHYLQVWNKAWNLTRRVHCKVFFFLNLYLIQLLRDALILNYFIHIIRLRFPFQITDIWQWWISRNSSHHEGNKI